MTSSPSPAAPDQPERTVTTHELVAMRYEDEKRRERIWKLTKGLIQFWRVTPWRELTMSERKAVRSCLGSVAAGLVLAAPLPIWLSLKAQNHGSGVFVKYLLPFGVLYPTLGGISTLFSTRYCALCCASVPTNTPTGAAYQEIDRERKSYEKWRMEKFEKYKM